MASGGGGCSASERLPPPFPGLESESEGVAGGSEPEAGDSDTEGEDIFTGAATAVSSHPCQGVASAGAGSRGAQPGKSEATAMGCRRPGGCGPLLCVLLRARGLERVWDVGWSWMSAES